MLQKLNKRNDEGFTIIEVLIVLAIAGLILLIVFLAVPALQRNARNTQRKNDVAQIASAVANFISNNGGTVPQLLGKDASANTLDVCNAGGNATGGVAACTGNIESAKMGFYTQNNVSMANGTAGGVTPAPTTTTVIIEYGENCDDTNTKGGTAQSRSAAVFYATESGGGNTSVQCIEQ